MADTPDTRTAAQTAADEAALSDKRAAEKKIAADKKAAVKVPLQPVFDPGPNPPPQAEHIPAAQIPGATANWSGRPDARPVRPGFRVQARKAGYYGDLYQRVGDVFTIHDEGDFADEWMVRVDSKTPEKTTSSNEALQREHAAIVSGASGPGMQTGRDDVSAQIPTGTADPLGTAGTDAAGYRVDAYGRRVD